MDRQSSHQPKPPNGTLYLFWFGAIVAAIFISFTSILMALGTGLGSTPEDPVSTASRAIWGVSGLSFLPIAVLLIVVTATRKRNHGVLLGMVIIAAGVLAAVGWFINAAGEMPNTTAGNVLVIAVVVVPLVVGSILIWRADRLSSA